MRQIIDYINETGINQCLCPGGGMNCCCENWWIIDPNHDRDMLDAVEERMDSRKSIAITDDREFDHLMEEWELFVGRVEELGRVMLTARDCTDNPGEWQGLGQICPTCQKEIYTRSDLQGVEHNCGCGTRFYRTCD